MEPLDSSGELPYNNIMGQPQCHQRKGNAVKVMYAVELWYRTGDRTRLVEGDVEAFTPAQAAAIVQNGVTLGHAVEGGPRPEFLTVTATRKEV